MPEIDVECPSGLSGTVRGLKARELNILGDRRAVRSGEALDRILRACWTKTTAPGPYDFKDGVPDWDRALQCDRFYTLMQIRVATYPDEKYAFGVGCQNGSCGENFDWELDLDELPYKDLPEESKAKVRSQELFETDLHGTKIKWKLATGKEEKRATRKVSSPTITAALGLRIVEVEGVARPSIDTWLEDLEVAECRDLLREFEAADGGVETEIEVECPYCLSVQRLDLPFSAEFFVPRTKGKKNSAAPKKKPRKKRR